MDDGEAAPPAVPEQNTYGLAEEVLGVLPSDPFAQLDVARKITSLALATRVSALESEAADLRHQLSDKDQLIADLRGQIQAFDALLSDAADRIAAADREKEAWLKEKDQLSTAISKLSRDVSKLEVFRKTLIRSIQEEDENSGGAQKAVASSSQSSGEENRLRVSPVLLSSSQTSTPRYTPPGSPPLFLGFGSPNTSNPATPRRSSVSFSTSRGAQDLGNGSGSQSRTRVDGKEFFRQVRSRLSYEQFGAFLANVKELNSHKQTKEETLRKADEIFGSDNRDLYTTFEGLLFRNTH